MTFNDIEQCIHLSLSTTFGITSLIVEEDKGTSFMGGQVAPIHPHVIDSLGHVPQKVCELVQAHIESTKLTPEAVREKTIVVRWGKVRFIDDTNTRISCVIGVQLIKGGAL